MLDQSPRFTSADAERLARDHFGLDGTAAPLTSERDQNFLIDGGDGRRLVLKIANASERREMLEAQQAAMRHAARELQTVPAVLASTNGETLIQADDPDGRRHFVWAIEALAGLPLRSVARRSGALYEDVGRQLGVLDRTLATFDHPAIHREFYWDLAGGRALVERNLPLVHDAGLRSAIESLMASFDRRVAPLLSKLPQAAIHGDGHEDNLLVAPSADVELDGQRVGGIVDFGDMVYSYRVAELAIAVAYAILGVDDPLTIAAYVVRGYAENISLDDSELAALFGLVALRLCMSACIAAEQQRAQPDNDYLGVSQADNRRTLPMLARIPLPLAEIVFRQAAGLRGSPRADAVAEYLRRANAKPVLGVDLTSEPTIVLDLSIASPMLSGDTRDNDEPCLTERIFAAMRHAGVRVSIGRYDEPRLLYIAPAFALGPKPTDEHRTIHIGLDLFANAGTPVYAPLDGTVHAFHDNATLQDYGPVIILRHETDRGIEFFTLYGHLSRESLARLRLGKPIKAGDVIATLGDPSVNVGWTPHLHLQIITDLLDLGTDFPGVACPSQRDAWTALCPDPNLIVGVPTATFPPEVPPKWITAAARRERIGDNLSVAYREPLRVVRGWMQYLYDDTGRCHVDAYNNVPHVGHCHPRVVEAGARQMRVLNTNTRYLSDLLAEYAERLLSTLPRQLDVAYFVNSASEANELALRLARAYTGARDMIVLDAAYHGNTTSLIDISPYKHAGPGGAGVPDWVHVAPLPDVYRGAHKRGDPQAGAKYAEQVGEIVDRLKRAARRPSAFIAETCPSVGGQLVLPPGYLANVYEYVWNAGGLCIADEVQTGLGRMGSSFWAFEDQGVVPDIVVMGKPLGNGHPIGAVATTRAVASAFANGMEYFSTFGGNTVSCAIGIAVLDVVRDEQLQAHAARVGEYLLTKLRPLADRHPIVGDVRGSGLFLGVELVRDRNTLDPAGAEASFVANRMRERGVLLGTDGPFHNVIKIRPPMPFDERDADVLVDALDRALGELPAECARTR
jgi:4-aminobutyrate aminotransferase-like enzyme/Ser/Thr protein kinase RdoA (MazF antagonist)/murein DD-endopeptidase MepM/ murein hydrolase activator NlpD